MTTVAEINAALPFGFRLGVFVEDEDGFSMTTPVSLDVRAHHSDLTPDAAERLGRGLVAAAELSRALLADDLGAVPSVSQEDTDA